MAQEAVVLAKPRSRGNGEGTVFKRTRNGSTRWYAEMVLGWDSEGKKRVLRSPACETKGQATGWLAERVTERSKGTLVEPSRETVGSHIEAWLITTAPHEVGPSTLPLYKKMYAWYLQPAIGALPLQQLKPQQIQALCHDMSIGKTRGKPVSPRTIQLALTVLRRSLQQAVEWNLIPRNPVDAVRPPKVERQEMRVLSPDQLADFIRVAKNERLHALFILAVTSGLRQGELLALQWRDVDLQKGTISVRRTRKVILDDDGTEEGTFGKPKTDAAVRSVPLAVVPLESLRRWKRSTLGDLQ